MGFIKKQWKARQGVGLNKFSIDGKPAVTLVNMPDNVIVPGDAFSEENMNDLENRIAAAVGTIYGVKIDKTNSNSYTAVEYTDNAVGLTPSNGNNGNFIAGSWENKFPFNSIKPCLFKDGQVAGYLNPNNYAQFEGGAVADITSGNSGDVMVEIPKVYYKITQDSKYTYVQISDNALDKVNGFVDYAHSYKGAVKDKFYIGAYTGFVDGNNKLRSLSGKTPTANKTIGAFRTTAQANGAGYEQLSFNKLLLLQILYLVRYKSLNSQTALGADLAGGSTAQSTGTSNTRGMNYGTSSSSVSAKCNGIENFWGNLHNWVDGYRSTSNSIKITDGNFNDTAEGYSKEIPCNIPNKGGYIKTVVGSTDLGFTPLDMSGSSTTYYSDYAWLLSGGLPFFGGSFDNDSSAGAFQFYCKYSASLASAYVGARLLFCN